jgi:hypothetical protein
LTISRRKKKIMSIPVRDDSGHVRGQIDGDDFIMTKYRGKHYLISYSAWALNKHVWNTIKKRRVKRMVIIEPDTGSTFYGDIEEFHGRELLGEMKTIHFVQDEQAVFPEQWFTKETSSQEPLF